MDNSAKNKTPNVEHMVRPNDPLRISFAQHHEDILLDRVFKDRRGSYLDITAPYELVSYTHDTSDQGDRLTAELHVNGEPVQIFGEGNGPISALVEALKTHTWIPLHVLDYHEHAISSGEDASAAAYVEADIDGEPIWGVGIHPSIVTASLRAIVNAVNRGLFLRDQQEATLRAFDV